MTRIITAIYEERDGWEMTAQLIDGILYLEDYVSPDELTKKSKEDLNRKLQTYYGCRSINSRSSFPQR